ncbi:hypothetical protein ADN00_17550 [Ornatilinea apprima]|uniref:Peptidase M55 n=1 Tax=Ornatilinea apprima TaxID=1134406 RepID=A0A0P6WYD7_9CHLR|nr:M55 family metallopeptidase [Ornatilinea apprima]KPL71483.1 hypothetical protein ADN00_17550 [Ornatilinea apprima]
MKLLIAADMEGISGVVNWNQVTSTHPDYARFRRLMTQDVNAAIDGAFRGGASEIIVADGHAGGYNILIEELDPRVSLNSGNPAPWAMIQGIDASFQGVMFIGYHAHMGTQSANLDHTWSSSQVANVWLNERLVGEAQINGGICGHYDVPVLMASGDQALAADLTEWIPGIEMAVVKQATSRYSGQCLPPAVSQKRISAAAEQAVKKALQGGAPRPLQFEAPVTVTVEFMHSAMADGAALLPYAQRVDARKVSFKAEDMLMAFRAFRAMVTLADR